MAAATFSVNNHSAVAKSFTLVGVSDTGALYRDATRTLALPLSVKFDYKVGAPGSKGNDRLFVTISDTVQNSSTGLVSTAAAKLEMSVPRDAAWAAGMTEDILAYMANLLTSGYRTAIADATVV